MTRDSARRSAVLLRGGFFVHHRERADAPTRASAPMTQCRRRRGEFSAWRAARRRCRRTASASAGRARHVRFAIQPGQPHRRPCWRRFPVRARRHRASVRRTSMRPICEGARARGARRTATWLRLVVPARRSARGRASACPPRPRGQYSTRSHVAASIARRWFSPCGQVEDGDARGFERLALLEHAHVQAAARWSDAGRPRGRRGPADARDVARVVVARRGRSGSGAGRGRAGTTPRRSTWSLYRGRTKSWAPAETARDIGKASVRRGSPRHAARRGLAPRERARGTTAPPVAPTRRRSVGGDDEIHPRRR